MGIWFSKFGLAGYLNLEQNFCCWGSVTRTFVLFLIFMNIYEYCAPVGLISLLSRYSNTMQIGPIKSTPVP